MKFLSQLFVIATLLLSLTAQAHDPSEHLKEKPKCAALEGMNPEKMDKEDPVTQALIKKCMKQLHQDDHSAEEQSESAEHDSHNK